MAKNSSEIVNEEADYQKRFEKLEKDASESRGLLDKIAKALKIDEAPPEPEKKTKAKTDDATSPPAKSGVVPLLQEIGILAKD